MSNYNIITNSILYKSDINNINSNEIEIDFDEAFVELKKLNDYLKKYDAKNFMPTVQTAMDAARYKDTRSLISILKNFSKPLIDLVYQLSLSTISGLLIEQLKK